MSREPSVVGVSANRQKLDKYLLDLTGPGKAYSQLQTLVNRFGRECYLTGLETGAAAGRQIAVDRLTALMMED